MRQLYFIATYYQLMTAIQIKTSLYPEEEADLIMSDNSVGAEATVEKLRALGIFSNVYLARVAEEHKVDTLKKKLRRTAKVLINDDSFLEQACELRRFDYDEFYFYPHVFFVSCLYYRIKKHNPQMRCYRFEEGYSCSFTMGALTNRTIRLQEKVRWLHGNPKLEIDGIYFYVPELSTIQDCPLLTIPPIDRSEGSVMRRVMEALFGDVDMGGYDRKYVFLETCYADDGVEMDDLELVMKIAEKVGPENLMVKMHPRTRIDRFTPRGIKTNKTVGIPWEAVLINNDFSDKVLLTIASGSALSPRLLLGESFPTYMLFNCTRFRDPLVTGAFYSYLERFRSRYGKTGFYVPNDLEEFLNILS